MCTGVLLHNTLTITLVCFLRLHGLHGICRQQWSWCRVRECIGRLRDSRSITMGQTVLSAGSVTHSTHFIHQWAASDLLFTRQVCFRSDACILLICRGWVAVIVFIWSCFWSIFVNCNYWKCIVCCCLQNTHKGMHSSVGIDVGEAWLHYIGGPQPTKITINDKIKHRLVPLTSLKRFYFTQETSGSSYNTIIIIMADTAPPPQSVSCDIC